MKTGLNSQKQHKDLKEKLNSWKPHLNTTVTAGSIPMLGNREHLSVVLNELPIRNTAAA